MICPKCYKRYQKKSYLEKHLKSENCLKDNEFYNQPELNIKSLLQEPDEIENAIQEVTSKMKTKKETITTLNNDIDKVVSKIFINENESMKKQIELLFEEVNFLKERIKVLEGNQPVEITEPNTPNYSDKKGIRREKINLDDELIKLHLNNKSLESDAELLYIYYSENTDFFPIRKIKKNDCSFWNGVDWVEDLGGKNLRSILAENLKKTYTKVNIIESNSLSPNYLINQQYINNLSGSKYQQQLYSYFMDRYCL